MRGLLTGCRALGDETRLRILRLLQVGSFHVNEIVVALDLSQPRISRHLRILTQAGLVASRREGAHVWYALRPVATDSPAGRLLAVLGAVAGSAATGPAGDEVFHPADHTRLASVLAERKRREAEVRDLIAPRWYEVRETYLGGLDEAAVLAPLLGLGAGVPAGQPGLESGRPGPGPRDLAAGHDPGWTVVDLGCGDGRLLCSLAALAAAGATAGPAVAGWRGIGIDRSPAMIAAATAQAGAARHAHLEFRLGDLSHLPLPDRQADAVLACMVLHHLDQLLPVLREVARVLRPGGQLHILDFQRHDDERLLQECHDRRGGFARDELRAVCLEAGLAVPAFHALSLASARLPVFVASVASRATGSAAAPGDGASPPLHVQTTTL